MILVEIVEESAGTDRMPGDFEVVNVLVPVVPNVVYRRHGKTIPNLNDPTHQTHQTHPTYPTYLTYPTYPTYPTPTYPTYLAYPTYPTYPT
jgi:hypothetical protein